MENSAESHIIEQVAPAEMEVRGKTYTYIGKNGKEKRIHREWKVSTAKQQRNKELSDYFDNNLERIQGMKNIKQVMRDYNDSHETQVSYNIIYKKYNSIFNTRKTRAKQVTQEEPVTIDESTNEE